jgi:hypothetical protein
MKVSVIFDNKDYYIMILSKQLYWLSCCHLTFRKIYNGRFWRFNFWCLFYFCDFTFDTFIELKKKIRLQPK